MEQRSTRFEYLLTFKSVDCAIFKSLDGIAGRLDKDWDATEECDLERSNAHAPTFAKKSPTSSRNGNPFL
jgi:hypothetical protein